jgi:hypothetical protein
MTVDCHQLLANPLRSSWGGVLSSTHVTCEPAFAKNAEWRSSGELLSEDAGEPGVLLSSPLLLAISVARLSVRLSPELPGPDPPC